MADAHDSYRRMLLTALAGITLSKVMLTPAAAGRVDTPNNSRTLVVSFSRSGNTRVIAGVIHRSLKTDLFEIEPATPYPQDYFQTVALAKNQRDRGVHPALKNSIANIADYQTLYLGFPIWGTTVPPVVQTFLSTHNLADKLLIPFITHGGYGIGDSEEMLAKLAPAARREKPLVIECDQERKTTETVTSWLEAIRS
ncbi:flavodoxin [Erwiniaceae bacterium BAC15a-03b]|uniref:Flavodoxin n=1 Tax=Winslowiella arboricola TaxID=2978220 RepID=A0A9J6PTJ1_9GAMM|nr:flavodoxin [Winslowiella arboricola]MCU5774842.1 flavodoxin [Winslowiella arboricola]MCU5780006.1 flavodoxin [Winslowiella arboricola]